MDVKLELNKVYMNRLLQSQNEISEFEKALKSLVSIGDASIIWSLCLGFDDETEQYEVMFGLVHGIEHLYQENIEEGLYSIALAVPSVVDRAKEWIEILHYRILNHEQVRRIYGEILAKLDAKTKDVIVNFLNDIKKEDPKLFASCVDEVLKAI